MEDAAWNNDLLRVKGGFERQIVKEKEGQIKRIGRISHRQDQSAGGDSLGKFVSGRQAGPWSREHDDAEMVQGTTDVQKEARWSVDVVGADSVPAGGRAMSDMFADGGGEGEQTAAVGGNHDGTAA